MKTVFVFGAGLTNCLGIPTSADQIKIIERFKNRDNKDVLYRLKQILDELFDQEGYQINDVFNLLDSSLFLHSALVSKNRTIEAYELEDCKTKLLACIFEEFSKKIKNNKNSYTQYVSFYEKLLQKEISRKYASNLDFQNRNFFTSSFSIINFNWDLYSLLPIIEANNRLNHKNCWYYPYKRNPQLRSYVDFNCEYASRDTSDNLWYPFGDAVAFIVNSEKYDTNRRVFLTKCFYPHGAMNLFRCPTCSKHSYYLGNLTVTDVAEKIDYETPNAELYKCPYCGHNIGNMNFDVLPQSNFKTRNSYFEEQRLSIINQLRNAERLIFIGYSLPPDDVDYRTIFKTLKKTAKEVYVVGYNSNESEKDFVPYDKLDVDSKENVKNFNEIFGDAKYCMKGAPDAFDLILSLVND